MAIRLIGIAAVALSGVLIYGATQEPERVIRGQNYATQEAHDAVQDQRLSAVESLAKATGEMSVAVNDKLTYVLGGLAGFGALLAFLQVYQIKKKTQ